MNALYLDELLGKRPSKFDDLPASRLVRIRVDRAGATMAPLVDSAIAGHFFDFPAINERFAGSSSSCSRAVRFVWGLGAARPTLVANQIVKLDVRGQPGQHRTFALPHTTPGEPIFVERPGATAEDDGALLSWCNNDLDGTSSLVVLDAASLQLMTRLDCPVGLPYGFHGVWLPATVQPT